MATDRRRASRALLRGSRRALSGARNALELLRLGQLSPAARRPFVVVARDPHARLRRYVLPDGSLPPTSSPAILLVPPLMVTAEIYDVSADSSGVGALLERGLAPWVVDFGAPEREAGGMERTLDDHVLAVSRAIDVVREITGRDVHLAGYSQGGMFCYQVAALRRSEGVASIVTFGSPVDLHRGVPSVHSDAIEMLTRAIGPALGKLLDRIEGLPAELTSTAFKLITPAKEIQQRLDFVRKLHDRGALERREARRRFLGGEGFVAWPGPALRAFVEQFVIHNRMLSGGFVVGGRTATLADVTCPVLAFIGLDDEMARPATIRGLTRAAPDAAVSFVELRAGHFGLVVGTRANRETWPTVAAWALHREGKGPPPAATASPPPDAPRPRDDEPEEAAFDDVLVDADLVWETASAAAGRVWHRLGDMAASASDAALAMRYQLPRFRRLSTLRSEEPISPARLLAHRARKSAEATFFLWGGRAFSYAEAQRRVDAVALGLIACGVRAGDRVGVWMGSRPSFLTVVTALSRIGAAAVVAPPSASPEEVSRAFARSGVSRRVADPPRAPLLTFAGEVLVLGGGAAPRVLAPGLRDMEAIDVGGLAWPDDLPPDGALARDLALILLRPPREGGDGALVGTAMTNHRWALGAMGAAGACTLRPEDTVFSCMPLHHPTSLVVAVGAALVAGCRLALAAVDRGRLFAPESDAAARETLADIRRYGATVVFYAGELVQGLLRAPTRPQDRDMPVRLFAGSGMRPATREAVTRRFGAGVLEFYASSSQRLVLAEVSGRKRGALGRPLPGSARIAVVRIDATNDSPARDAAGRLVRAAPHQPGLLIVEIDRREAAARREAGLPIVEDAFSSGERWAPTGDVLRLDDDGDAWFVDTLGGRLGGDERGPRWAREIEDALAEDPDVELAVAFTDHGQPGTIGAAVVLRPGASVAAYAARVRRADSGARWVRVTPVLPMNEGFRCDRRAVARLVDASRDGDVLVRCDRPAEEPSPASVRDGH